MQNLTRNTILLTAFTLLLVPAASAQGIASVDLSASAHVDASAATDAAYDAKAKAEGLVGEAKLTAAGAVADVQAQAEGLQAEAQAHAQASTEEAIGFGEKAKAAFENALDGIKGFAAGIAAHLSFDATVG